MILLVIIVFSLMVMTLIMITAVGMVNVETREDIIMVSVVSVTMVLILLNGMVLIT